MVAPIHGPIGSGCGTLPKIAATMYSARDGTQYVHRRQQVTEERWRWWRIIPAQRLEVDRVHDDRREQEHHQRPEVEQAFSRVADVVPKLDEHVQDEPDGADDEEGETRLVDAPPDARRVLVVRPAPNRPGRAHAVYGGRAVGVGAEQVDEQEDQADDDHGPVGLYAKVVPDDGLKWPNG